MIEINKRWNTVCAQGVTDATALAACRMLGFQGGRCGMQIRNYPGGGSSECEAYPAAYFGNGTGGQLSGLACIGNEKDLNMCDYNLLSSQACTHDWDAGIECWNSEPFHVAAVLRAPLHSMLPMCALLQVAYFPTLSWLAAASLQREC